MIIKCELMFNSGLHTSETFTIDESYERDARVCVCEGVSAVLKVLMEWIEEEQLRTYQMVLGTKIEILPAETALKGAE